MSQDCVGSPGPSKMKSAFWELSSLWEVGCQMLSNKEALGLDCLPWAPGYTTCCCVTVAGYLNFLCSSLLICEMIFTSQSSREVYN